VIKYIPEDTSVVLEEIPEEITLAINISNCPGCCPGCHSPYLQEDIGEELTDEILRNLIEKNIGISCVSFMGEGRDKEALLSLTHTVRNKGLKVALYSGRYKVEDEYNSYFDYIKVGPYIESKGPLRKTTTNQVLYKIINGKRVDTTYLFWRIPGCTPEYVVNPDHDHTEKIRKALEKNVEKYGEKYCPCNVLRSEDTICPCKDYRESGNCHCKLYIK